MVASGIAKPINAEIWIAAVGFGRGGCWLHPELGMKVRGENFVRAFEVAISTRAGAGTETADWWRRRLWRNLHNFDYILLWYIWDAHVVQSVILIEMLIVEPWAVACLPRGCTDHAELRRTATSTCEYIGIGQ